MDKDYVRAENDYLLGMTYAGIADKYKVSINTVKSWKTRYGWSRDGTQKNKEGKGKKVCTQKSKKCAHKEKVALDVGTEIEDENELSDSEQLFCFYYSRTFNRVQSYLRVYNCEYFSAASSANRLLKKEKIKKELARLQELKKEQIKATVEDVRELQTRIVFADLTGIVTVKTSEDGGCSYVEIEHPEQIDMQLVRKIKNTKYGIEIELKDSQRAADWLLKYEQDNVRKKSEEEEKEEEYAVQLTEVDTDGYESDMDATAETSSVHEQTGE